MKFAVLALLGLAKAQANIDTPISEATSNASVLIAAAGMELAYTNPYELAGQLINRCDGNGGVKDKKLT